MNTELWKIIEENFRFLQQYLEQTLLWNIIDGKLMYGIKDHRRTIEHLLLEKE